MTVFTNHLGVSRADGTMSVFKDQLKSVTVDLCYLQKTGVIRLSFKLPSPDL